MQTLLIKYRFALIQLSHLLLIIGSMFGAFFLRFDFAIPKEYDHLIYEGLMIAIPVKLVTFHMSGLSGGWWRYLSLADLIRLVSAKLAAAVAFAIATSLIIGREFPRSIYIIDPMLVLAGLAALRVSARLYYEREVRALKNDAAGGAKKKKILVYGAGMAAKTLLSEIQYDASLNYDVVGLIDDDPDKSGLVLNGVQVLGPGAELDVIVDKLRRRAVRIDEIVVAMPSANLHQMQTVLGNCRAAHLRSKTVPGYGDLLRGKGLASQIHEISISDLLGREPVHIDEEYVRGSIAGKTIMVTGATGSIGSELTRQIAPFGPGRLIVFDQAESELFKHDHALRAMFPEIEITSIVGDIRSIGTLDDVIVKFNVEAIFHAAAYKHVPLMEQFPLEAVRNNVIGTWNLAQAAYRNNVATFVMISSDKAVNPTSVMGATKRLAEQILSAMPTDRTKFVAVRFGNVLGSNGSVVPIFQRQINEGGPITVTHPDMRRYFMTIPEAAQLVLMASTLGHDSEVFVLDMGEPIRIVDLAETMIRLAGKEPGVDIEILFTGIRSGEKLYEEISCGEDLVPTSHKKILIFKGRKAGKDLIERGIPTLERLLIARDQEGVMEHLMKLIPEFTPDFVIPKRGPEPVKGLTAAQAAGGN